MMLGNRPHTRRLPVVIAAGGVVIFAGLAITCWLFYTQTEDRLLQQRTNEAAAVLELSIDQVHSPLSSFAAMAAINSGDAATFTRATATSVGPELMFSSAVLFRMGDTTPIATVGHPSGLVDPSRVLEQVRQQPFLVFDLTAGPVRRLGYAVSDDPAHPHYVVYAERELAADPHARRLSQQPFAQLDYAIYLGNDEAEAHLLGTSVARTPITGRRAARNIAFGQTQLRLVMTPIGHLSGGLLLNLWWIVLAVGAATTTTVTLLTRRLLDRTQAATELAVDNERLYAEQRRIAETLQLSLLPQHLEAPPMVDIAVRYWPAGEAQLIGGDFYDAFQVDDNRWAVLIGDVCGKGVEAAALTGLAVHAARTAARLSAHASEVLEAIHLEISAREPSTYCTACFVYLSPDSQGGATLELALGGHPRPLLGRRDGRVEEIGTYGTMLGMIEPQLHDTVVRVEPGDTLVLYTDGLTDAPRDQAVPIEEITSLLARSGTSSVDRLADDIRVLKRSRRPRGSADDTAIVVLRLARSGRSATELDSSTAERIHC